MAASTEDLFRRLDALGIVHLTHHHPPLHRVAQSVALRGSLPGGHCKSLFLRDGKAGLWLVVVDEERQLDLKALAKHLGAPRFSFGSPALMQEVLGVTPGSVTPFALINDAALRVTPVLDQAMLEHHPLNYHPLVNTATTAVSAADLLRFIVACGHRPVVVAMDAFDRGGSLGGACQNEGRPPSLGDE
ncbi:MAG TPA: prolyl-tRNA synthetase associated domain-containing protein [Stellaceae bacterium]|nr:prolyl-tRNA synthetase associated domain-containing protein [Stellaceae bacterium]